MNSQQGMFGKLIRGSKWLVAVCFALIVGQGLAGTVHVAKGGNDTTGDGTEGNPYRTIQKGIDMASTDDTVLVGEGDFADIGGSSGNVPTVAVINKKITLKGAGRGKTFITGAHGDDAVTGIGTGAHRCIYMEAAGTGAEVRDLTVRRGATTGGGTGWDAVNVSSVGGGIAAEAGDGNILYVYDCDILDCRAGEGGATAHDVRACRCRFAGNRAKGGQHVFCRNKYTYNCLFENNGPAAGSARAGWMFNYVTGFTMVNCTFVNNNVDRLLHAFNSDAKMCLYNSFVIDTKPLDGGATTADYDLRNVVQNWPLSQASKIQSYAAYGCKWDVCKATQYFSPADDDWRSLPGNAIVGAGNADFVTTETTGIPAGEISTDYFGNPRFAGGKVSVGCFEPEIVPAERIVGSFLLAGGATVTKDGRILSGEPAVAGRWWGLEGCGQVRVGYAGSDELFGWTVANDRGILGGESYTVARFPDNNADRGFWLTPTKGGLATITAIPATEVKWVDDDADEGTADGTKDNPYVTVADAVAAVAPRGLIKVKPGTYDAGTVTDGGKVCRFSLSKDVAIRSTDGAEKTVLKGGEGLDAIVLSTDATNKRYAQVQGFTLTGCANDPSKDANQGTTGAAWLCGYYEAGDNATARGYSEGVHLTDSVISNNVAIRACAGGWLERCRLIDNFTTVANMNTGTSGQRGTQAYAAILSGCVSYYSDIYFTPGNRPTVNTCAHQNCTDINCSFHVPDVDASGLGYRTLNVPNGMTVAINTTMISPRLDGYTPTADRYAAGCVTSPGNDRDGWVKAVPEGEFFTDVAAHDYHPLSGSVGLGYSVVTTNKYVRFETGDFNGKPLAYETNGGKPIPGAFQEVCALRVSQDASRGTPSVTGNVYAQAGEEITVSATPASSDLRLRGWFVDGGFTETGVAPLAITVDLAKKPQSVLPVFARDLYVNANAADDTGDGLTPETAKKLLSSVGALAVYGDVIHAAPGAYADGQMVQTKMIYRLNAGTGYEGTGFSPSRIVLTNAVMLVSDEGAGVTSIAGVFNKGPDGVRCVTAYAGASVKGFRLSGGSTSAQTGNEYDENMGGIVLAPKATSKAATALIEDCVISDGNARTGGCVAGGYLHRCQIFRGYSGAGSSLTQYATLDHCVALGSSNTGVRDYYGVYSSVVVNTAGGGNDMAAVGNAACENSIVALKNSDGGKVGTETHKNMKNCIWNVGDGLAKIDGATCCNVVTCTVDLASVDAALASLGLDGSGRPSAGAPSVDEGDNALLAALADPLHDKGGVQRIYNAAVDIGAYEYVCTNEFTAAVCGRRSQVTDASPMVALGDGEVLDIPADEELCIGWKSKRAGASAKLGVATLADGASLQVFAGGDLLTTISSVGTYELTADAPMMNLRLVAKDGAAEVSSFDPNREGLGVIIR